MTTHSPPRRTAAILTTLAVAAGTLLLPTAAIAAEGAAPTPTEYRVIAGVHTDAVSTFLDDGQLALGSKADVAEGSGTRFAADDVWFHLEDAAQQTLPAGYEFIAPAGSTVWMAPESNPGTGRLWPGFNTESIAPGAIERDTTMFTLTGFDGPGELEVFTSGVFGAPKRLWSSQDDELRSFEIGRTHMHANWAFTAPGTYRLDVEGGVTVVGVPQTASATYTFVVGDLPEPVVTTTRLSASATSLISGDPVELTATVTPADADGYVEFRTGATVLGHEPVTDGAAMFTATAPAVGSHSLTAVYVPAVANTAATSTSEPVTVTVTDGSGVEFGIAGIAPEYTAGETLDARVVGHTLQEGEIYRWVWRQVGTESAYVLTGGGQEAAGQLTLPVGMAHDDYEVSVQVRQGRTTVTQSSWVPINVRSDVQPLTPIFPDGTMYLGDELFVELDGTLAEGDSIRVAQRGTAGPWFAFTKFVQIDADTLQLKPTWYSTGVSWTIQTVRNDVVVAQSEPVTKDVLLREVHVEGLQGVYRVGQTLKATASVYPAMEGLTYTWSLQRSLTEAPYFERQVIKEGNTEAELSLELPVKAGHDGWTLSFDSGLPEGHPSGATQVGSYSQKLNVSDSSPDTQLLFFSTLSGHYHQGYDVNLDLVADPALADGDTLTWEWKWPETDDWVTLPGASGLSHQLIAEQALDGVEVRAVLSFAEGGDELIADPVTILVDDHGSPARQKVVITGSAVVDGTLTATEGDSVAVTAEVENGTVLDSFQWFLKLPGAAEATPIHGATSAIYEFAATGEHDGAELSVAVVKPNGQLAYGPSEAVTLAVEESGEEQPAIIVTISGLEDSYRPGDTMTLKASQDPDTGADHWHWFIKPAGADNYTVVDGQLTSTLTREVTAGDNGAAIIARLYDHDHTVLAESTPVTVSVQDDGEEPVGTTVSLTGLADAYDVGDTMTLTASQDPDTGLTDWHWYLKPAGADDYTVINGQNTATLTREIAAGDNGASILARLFDAEHNLVAESAPVIVTVNDDEEAPGGKPTNGPEDRSVADLGETPAGGIDLGAATVAPGDLLQVVLGAEHANTWTAAWLFSTPTLLADDWLLATGSGSITVQIPVDTALGDHRLAVFAPDGSLIGWANLTVAQPSDVDSGSAIGTGGLAVTGGTLSIAAVGIAILLTFGGTLLVMIRRRRTANE